MKLWQKQALFAQNIAKLIDYIYREGYFISLGEAYRTPEQAKLNADKGIGIVNSLHCDRLALDINLFNSKGEFLSKTSDHIKFGLMWEGLHPLNRWGGHFKKEDGNHYEMQNINT